MISKYLETLPGMGFAGLFKTLPAWVKNRNMTRNPSGRGDKD